MELAQPLWLLLLPFVLAVAVIVSRARRALPLPAASGATVRSRRSAWLAAAPMTLRALTLTLLVLALARPRSPGGLVEESSAGIPIVVAIDVSSSMLAQDWRCEDPPCPAGADSRDRLEVAKGTVRRFVETRAADPIGLVAFAAEAITLVPITRHRPLLLSALESLRVGLLEDGTAIGEGLATAVNRLRRASGDTRVAVLMSDGESNRGEIDPLEAASAAAALGIQVYTIGVGSVGTASVPVRREAEGVRYEEAPVGVDEALLRQIAEMTGGEYYRAANPAALERIYARIDRLIPAPVETRRFVRYTEWYLWLLAAAAGTLLLEWALRASRWGAVP